MDPAITLTSAGTLSVAQVLDFRANAFGESRPATHPGGNFGGFGQAALKDGALVGLITGSLLVDNTNAEERLLYLSGGVHPASRGRGIGRALIEALAGACRDTGRRVTAVAHLSEEEAASTAPFLTRVGFVEAAGSAFYERDLGGATPPPALAEPYSTRQYGGGDAALDAAILNLYRRAYRGRPHVPELTAKGLQDQLAHPDIEYVLIFDGGCLAGHASAFVSAEEYYVDSILVARPYWGTGVSDALGDAITRRALQAGIPRLTGAADTTNRANRALMERHGLRVTEIRPRYCRVFEIG